MEYHFCSSEDDFTITFIKGHNLYHVCGPMNVRVRHEGNYFIIFIDDFTRSSHIYLISHKSEALDCFIRFTNLVENKLSTKIKALRTDRGCEYLYE